VSADFFDHTVGSQNISEFDVPRGPKATGYVAFFYDRRLSEVRFATLQTELCGEFCLCEISNDAHISIST
jgi:hypothetical protein